MSIPTYDKFIEPVLCYLADHPDGERASVVYDAGS
jgi:restriction endonuclease Mrr